MPNSTLTKIPISGFVLSDPSFIGTAQKNSSIETVFLFTKAHVIMIAWIFTNYFRDIMNPPHPTQMTAQSLLSSAIADGDIITDWLYYIHNFMHNKELLNIQLFCCISGTISWFTVASDGRILTWIRSLKYIFLSLPFCILWVILFTPYWLVDQFEGSGGTTQTVNDWIRDHGILPLWNKARDQKASYSSGTLLLLGIIFEDIPQMIITVLIQENTTKGESTSGQQRSSYNALFNLLFATFDICHKVAQAWDLRFDVLNSFYKVKTTVKAHQRSLTVLTAVGTNEILSSSWWDDNVKLWDARLLARRSVQKFFCAAGVNDVVAIGVSKVIAACRDKHIRFFDLQSKRLLGEPLVLEFIPEFICVSPTSSSFFTSRRCDCRYDENTQSSCPKCNIRRYDVNYGRPFLYNRPASSLTFLDKIHFVSTCRGSSDVYIWNFNETEPISIIEIESPGIVRVPVIAMNARLFLTGDGSAIKSWKYENAEWSCINIFYGHEFDVLSLEKVNYSLFISTSDDCTAKLWNLANESCLFTFLGHTDVSVHSAVFLKERCSVATGDGDGHLKIWSIKKFIKEDEKDEEELPLVNSGLTDSNSIDHVRYCWYLSRSRRNLPLGVRIGRNLEIDIQN